jgi:hypothetical protein
MAPAYIRTFKRMPREWWKTAEWKGQNRPKWHGFRKTPRKNANDHGTEGARTSGAAELFSGRPSAGAIKHQRRRCLPDRNAAGVPQGEDHPKTSIGELFGSAQLSGELANAERFD